MIRFLKRHYFPFFVIGGVTAGCIHTGNWIPFLILAIVLVCAGLVTAIVLAIFAEKKRRDEMFDRIKKTRRIIHVQHIIETRPEDMFVPNDRFEQDHDETIH